MSPSPLRLLLRVSPGHGWHPKGVPISGQSPGWTQDAPCPIIGLLVGAV